MKDTREINSLLADIRQQFERTQVKRCPQEKRGDEYYHRFGRATFRELQRDFLQLKRLVDGVSIFADRRVSGSSEWSREEER